MYLFKMVNGGLDWILLQNVIEKLQWITKYIFFFSKNKVGMASGEAKRSVLSLSH